MKRVYQFYDKEALDPRKVTYDYPVPFEKNMDKDFRNTYGADLTFVKELNHRDRIVRLHSAYSSGKGTRYVAAVDKKAPLEEKFAWQDQWIKEEMARAKLRASRPASVIDYPNWQIDDLIEVAKDKDNVLELAMLYNYLVPDLSLGERIQRANILIKQYERFIRE